MPNAGQIVGSWDSPIVMGLTPWNRTTVRAPGIVKQWPPLDDAERLDRYAEYEALIENRPYDVFSRLEVPRDQQSRLMLAVAIPELLCNVWADSVWGEAAPDIELPSTAADDAWQAIDDANEFSETRAWESVFSASMLGTSVLRLFRSEELGALTGSPVQIEEIPASMFFPVLRKGSDRLIDYVVLAWEENRPTDDGKDEIWHVRQRHVLDNGKYTIVTDERKAKAEFFSRVKVENTDLDFLPFVDMHGARWAGRYWGVSELARAVSLFADIDDTLSTTSEILEYHGSPMLQVPASAVFGGTYTKGVDKTLGIRNPDEADVARYITYDGMIDSQLSEIDKVLELIFLTAEVPRTYFGLGLEGQNAPSGTALRLQVQNYLKKAARWQRRDTRRTGTVVDYSLRITGKFSDPEARKAKITHGSPLPADEEQDARIETALHTAGMSSLKLSLRKLRRVPADEIDDEIAAIEAEKEASVQAAQDAFGGAPNPPADNQPPVPPARRGGPPPSRRGGSSAARQQ